MKHRIPASEKRRLRALKTYDVADGEVIASFERVCRLACELFHVPIAFITFVEESRVVVKASHGFEGRGCPRDHALCSHTILLDRPLVVTDARADPRFAGNPHVVHVPLLRFYAGAPLAVERGVNLGSLCIVDRVPRAFSDTESELLRSLAHLVVDQITAHRARRDAQRALKRRQKSERELREKAEALHRREALLAQTARMARIGGWDYDIRKKQLSLSEEAYRIHEAPACYVPTAGTLVDFYPVDARPTIAAALRAAVKTAQPFDVELPFASATGAQRWIRAVGEAVGEGGEVARLVGTFQDVTAAKLTEARVDYLANHDTLTGLPNRRRFQDRLDEAVAKAERRRSIVALCVIDLDHFKDINDTLGHGTGDGLLIRVAERLKSVLKPGDTLARLGGDEFAVILTHLKSPAEVTRSAGSLLDLFEVPVTHGDATLHIGASIGVTLYPNDDLCSAQLLKNADMALFRAKTLGRGRYNMFVPALKEGLESRQRAVSEVREAVGRDDLVLVYQPKVDLASNQVVGFEGLVRWQHPSKGLLAPGAFLAAFEDPGVAGMIGETVMQRAMADIRGFLDAGLDFGRIAINVAAVQFRHNDFAERVAQALSDRGVPPEMLEIEVTESVFLGRGSEAVGEALRQLHRMGVMIALDDFGTGYASLTHLKQFPVDTLKIDQTFVRDIGRDPDDAAIVRAVINLGHSLGMTVVAEGIETEAQLDYLKLCGCDQGQGYLFARPIPVATVPAFLRRFDAGMAGAAQVSG